MLGCKMRNWWILKYSCPKHNLKNNIPQEVVVEPMPNNELEMVEINLQDDNDYDQDNDNTRPIDVNNPPSHPQNNTSENIHVQDETNDDGIRDVPTLIRTNKNGIFKSRNCLTKF